MNIQRWMLAAVAAFGITLGAHAQYASKPPAPATSTQTAQPAAVPVQDTGYYTNRAGQSVHRPERTVNNAVPAGATAQCRDGTYSFSRSRRGTCSHHGGVARWL